MYPTGGPTAATPYPSTTLALAYGRGEFNHPSSLSMGASAAATSSSIAATTSGVTSHPSNPFAVGADVFEVQPKPSVPAATASTPSGVTVPLGLSIQNTVVPGADAVQGPTLPVGVAVAGVPSTTAATFGLTSGDVKSTVDGATQSTSTGVVGQSSTTSTSSG